MIRFQSSAEFQPKFDYILVLKKGEDGVFFWGGETKENKERRENRKKKKEK